MPLAKQAIDSLHFQDTIFILGYRSYRIKQNDDPISGFLEGTESHRKFMAGWNTAKEELDILYKHF